MPRVYKRKPSATPRATWTEEALREASKEIKSNNMKLKTAARKFGIPPRTLRRRLENADLTKHGLGKRPTLGYENEKKLANHIQDLEKAGFPCTRWDVRRMAYQLVTKCKIMHNFNNDEKMAGKQWLQSFLERNSNLNIKRAGGISRARAKDFNTEKVQGFFNLLEKTLKENGLHNKSDRIFNMDEIVVQISNKSEEVVETEDSNLVQQITPSEEKKTVSIVACTNPEGRFLPPVVIMKGVNKKPEFLEGLPPGSRVFLNEKSADINSDLFYKWLTEHFIPRKPSGKVLLIIGSYALLTTNIDILEKANENDVILLCLPSHSTHSLQPLAESFFKPFKKYFANELQNWMLNNSEVKITKHQISNLIGAAWGLAVSISNAVNGFKASGIYPYNPNIIPDHYFAISEVPISLVETDILEQESDAVQQIPDMHNEL